MGKTRRICDGIWVDFFSLNSISDFFCLTPLNSISIKPYMCIQIVSKHDTPTKLTYFSLLITCIPTYEITWFFWCFGGGHMFWDNLNKLLGLGLHRFQWNETQKIWLRIEKEKITSNSKSDFLWLTPLKSMSIKPYISIHTVSKHDTPTKLTSFSLVTT